MTPGSHAETEETPSASADAFAPAPRGKKALFAALHRDFDDARDFPAQSSTVGDAWSSALPDNQTVEVGRNRRPWTPLQWLITAVGIVLLAQVPLLWAFSQASAGQGPALFTCLDLGTPRLHEMSPRERLVLEQRCNPDVRSVETFITADGPVDDVPKHAQVVELDMPEAQHPAPVETKYVADRTTRTAHETRSEAAARANRKAPRGQKVAKPTPQASDAGQRPEPTSAPDDAPAPKPDEVPQDAEGEAGKAPGQKSDPRVADIIEYPKGDTGNLPERKAMQRGDGQGARILMPATSEKNVLANLQALAGDFTSNDHLPDVERGKGTVLNANSYRYADFFHSVKRAVERYWQPSELYLRRDPTGQVYGVKDRYTVLRVEIDRTGKIENLVTVRLSGLDFMDEEAKRAFREAQPFPNPPLGLADPDGKIRFEFGFFFEITGGKYRFNWRRL